MSPTCDTPRSQRATVAGGLAHRANESTDESVARDEGELFSPCSSTGKRVRSAVLSETDDDEGPGAVARTLKMPDGANSKEASSPSSSPFAQQHQEETGSDNSEEAAKVAEEVLDFVIRNRSLQPRDKIRQIGDVCKRENGWIVAQCLSGNGWNAASRCLERQPHWEMAVHSIALGISNVRSAQKLSLNQGKKLVFVYTDSKRRAQACSWHYVGAQMLNPSQLSSLSSLSLANQNLSGKSLQALLASLRTYSQLSCLDLSGNPIQDSGSQFLASLLSNPKSRLRLLNVSNCMLWARGCLRVVEAVAEGRRLQALHMSHNDAGSPTGVALASLLRSDGSLTELNASNAGLGAAGLDAIGEALLRNTSLEVLDLGGNSMQGGTDVGLWGRVLALHPSLHSLRLSEPPCLPPLASPGPGEAADNGSFSLEEAAAAHGPVPLAERRQLAMAMALHPRLGKRSPLRALSDHVLEEIVGLLENQFVLTLCR